MIRTRLTERFGLTHPVVSAPMAFAAGGRLAAAVSAAGGLGLIGAARETEGARWGAAFAAGDPEGSNTFVGEAVGLIGEIRPAGEIVGGMVAEAERLVGGGWRRG